MAKNNTRKEPDVGRQFQHRYMGDVYTLTVVKTDSGIGYELLGEVYRSPTAAAKALVGKDQSTNGRKFWHIDD
ncbi:hypothetical protein Poly24_27450 [Rosistilla carotiformis]|uniref:Uncharacterized protein n=1 Tax=Rosistilla carotiformis TaxID=2528017 RepID=A0A518JU01_9BACT|nr:hypothetical protein [Rosistilla carotiformis]QDV69031.1 hypothetical protein Poly24_27450 [Rosistilla carotiformis]